MPLDPRNVVFQARQMMPAIGRVHVFNTIFSTQDEALHIARSQKAADLTLVVAHSQRAGRGRQGRRWFSPRGAGLYVTFILRPKAPPERWPTLSVIVGSAVVETLRQAGIEDCVLKWPNDCLIRGRKVAGLLLEAFVDEGFLLLGLGVNVDFGDMGLPEDLEGTATDLKTHLPGGRSVERVAAHLLATVAKAYLSSPAFEVDPDRVGPLLWTRGEVEVEGRRGTVLGLDRDGRLRLRLKSGEEVALSSGEVSDAPGP